VRSFQVSRDLRREVYLALAGAIESQLRDAYARRNEAGLCTQSSLAEKLDVNRSAVHRRLTGQTNMTIRSLADMVWALDHCISLEIFDPGSRVGSNEPLPPHAGNFNPLPILQPVRSIAASPSPVLHTTYVAEPAVGPV
jgi:hypothetical protein